ncbi:alpha/beta fold hydrolase [Minwuia thermotolerans]|uniref:Alpha/beta hydrolase n=1 Tax=Minwuia thermotolerans TaxID=2056226 RepID=A0A2M9FYC9_9PROT|nr:alpha/beta hydrolase [Minwuia thermotolerans]PJK28460.1 alpha/beta hydrolase [Minwuia thermotolerans]
MEFTIDGNKVFAHTGGRAFDPKGDVVVLIHGAAMNHLAWALQTRWLAHHGHSVLAVDLPGCGRSEGELPDSIEECGRWLHRLLDELGVGKARLIGHSMGALIAMEAAGQQPERIRALGLLGFCYPLAVNEAFLDAAKNDLPLAIGLMNDWAHGPRAHFGGFQVPGLWMVGADTRVIEQARPGVLHKCLAICSAYKGGEKAAAAVGCPATVVLGRQDLMTPLKAGRKTAAMIGGAAVTELDDCGHMMMFEQPKALLRALAPVLAA